LSPFKKSVKFKEPQKEFYPDYSIYDSDKQSPSPLRDTFARSDTPPDETGEEMDLEMSQNIPFEGDKKSVRSSKFSATKDKTQFSTKQRRTEVNRLFKSNRLTTSSGPFGLKRSTAINRPSAQSAKYNYNYATEGKPNMRPSSASRTRGVKTAKVQDDLKILAQKFKKYAELEFEEVKLRNKL